MMPMGRKKKRYCEASLSRTDAQVKTICDVWRDTLKTAQVNMRQEFRTWKHIQTTKQMKNCVLPGEIRWWQHRLKRHRSFVQEAPLLPPSVCQSWCRHHHMWFRMMQYIIIIIDVVIIITIMMMMRMPVNEVADPGAKYKNGNRTRQSVHCNQLEAVWLKFGVSSSLSSSVSPYNQ